MDDMEDIQDNMHEIEEADEVQAYKKDVSVKIYLWEFSQNDPKRDSGVKLVRQGYASQLKAGRTFSGIVLSAEASKVLSPEDAEMIRGHGIAGINCSWNRLDEVPTNTLGKARNQRRLPLLFAANTVNYGKPWKMNTAEAIAAGLYIAGLVEDARTILYPFSYGAEFLRLNSVFFDAYAACNGEREINAASEAFLAGIEQKKQDKQAKSASSKRAEGNIGGYMDDMDLPPMDSSEGEWEEEEEEEVAGGDGKETI